MDGGRLLTLSRCLMYLGFIAWSTNTFFKTQDGISKANDHFKKRSELTHLRHQTEKDSNKTVHRFEPMEYYCPLTSDTSLYYLLFAYEKYFLVLQPVFNSYPTSGTRLIENGDYLEREGELWLIDSFGRTTKRIKIESMAFSGEGEVPVLNYFGEYLSYKFCSKEEDLEEFARNLLGEYFPKT